MPEVRTYASDGFLKARTVGTIGGFINDTLYYDKRGLVTSAYTGYRSGQGSGVTATVGYNGLGAVVTADSYAGTGASAENFMVDALGNRLRRSQVALKPSYHPDYQGVRLMSYDSYGRMTAIDDTTLTSDPFIVQQRYDYDADGALWLEHSRKLDSYENPGINIYDQTRSYHSVDGKLSVVNRHVGISQVSDETHSGRHQVYQENWYDALGRRVLVRARKSSNCNNATHGDLACKSYVERTVWDGDQILIEKRMNGASGLSSSELDYGSGSSGAWGDVLSVHAHGIDQPIAVRKPGHTTVVPHANWMGDYEIGTTAAGTVTTSCNGASNCPLILWPGSKQTVDGQLVSHSAINTWWGILITEKTDPSGYKYMRNRYYNPQTGQFTQQDPIGLAGGLNLYGYAGADPVNFSDPFGLCPACATAGMGGALGTLILPGPGTVIGAVLGGAVGLVGGHYLGKWIAGKLANEEAVPLPDDLTGTEPREASGRTNTTGTGDPEKTFEGLTGGKWKTQPDGTRVGENGVRLREGTATKGPRIDIPAKGNRTHETIHYPRRNQ